MFLLDWPSIFQDFIVAIIAGIVVSFTFLLLLLKFLKPKFKISPFICFTDNKYRFKIVNRSIYHAFDARIELFEMEPYPHAGGKMNVNIKPISIETSNITTIPRCHSGPLDTDPYNLFAALFLTEEDLSTIIKKHGVYIEMRLTVRHGLTGLAATFVERFYNMANVKVDHKFCQGDNIDTMPKGQVTT